MGAETRVSVGANKGGAPSIWGLNASNQPAIPRSAFAAATGRRELGAERSGSSVVGACYSVRCSTANGDSMGAFFSARAARMVGAKGGEAGTWVTPMLCLD